jgi:RimJ/RimL family protein N-acetyltransferase
MSRPPLPKIFYHEADGSLHARLETPRLIIRSLEEGDLEELVKLQGDPRVMEFVGAGGGRERPQIERLHRGIRMWWEKGNPISGYVVLDRETNQFLGMAALEELYDEYPKVIPGEAEVMLYFHHDFWGKKFGKEVGQAFLQCIVASEVENVPIKVGGAPLTKLVATAEPNNLGSIALQKSLGFKQREQEPVTLIKGGKTIQRFHFDFDLTEILAAARAESKSPSSASATELLDKTKAAFPST